MVKEKKKASADHPAWKARRKEMKAMERKSKMWKVITGLIIALVAFFFVFTAIKMERRAENNRNIKPEEKIAQVAGKRLEHKGSTTQAIVSFRVDGHLLDKTVSMKDYDSFHNDDYVKVMCRMDRLTGLPLQLLSLKHMDIANAGPPKPQPK